MKDILGNFSYTIEKKRLSHLYILSGGSSLRQKRIVRELAYMIFKADNDYPQLKTQLEHDNHPNFLYIAKDGLSIKKEQVLALQEEFSKSSLVAGYRIYVIEAAETMSNAAANSLLKFLEEPKDGQTIGFLLTEDQSLILPTIRSRAQVVLLEEDTDKEFIELLLEHDITLKDAYYLTTLTKDFEEATLLIEDPNYQKASSSFEGLLQYLVEPKLPLSLLMFDLEKNFYNEKDWLIYIFELLSRIMLDVIHTHMNQKLDFEVHKETILQLVPKFSLEKAETVIRILHDTTKTFRLPVNISMTLQSLAIRLEEIIK